MGIRDFLKVLEQSGRLNIFVVCADDLLTNEIVRIALAKVANMEDIQMIAAAGISKEKARQIEVDARFAPRAGSTLQHFFIYGLQDLPADSVGPLLKAVEEAKYSRFIFQAQSLPRKIHTIMSRSSVIKLPFMTRSMVLSNLKHLHLDARTVQEMNLYDGTLGGAIRALSMKDTLSAFRREAAQGLRGLVVLCAEGQVASLAFPVATYDLFTQEERRFVGDQSLVTMEEPERSRVLARRKIVMFLAMARVK